MHSDGAIAREEGVFGYSCIRIIDRSFTYDLDLRKHREHVHGAAAFA